MSLIYRRSLLTLMLTACLSACDSSGITGGPAVSSITIPETQRETLESLPDIEFAGQYQSTASPDRGTGSTDDGVSAESDPVASTDMAASDSIALPPIFPAPPNPTIDPGTLTAGDYDDHLNPHLYQEYAGDYLQSRGQWIDTPRLDFNNRIRIVVRDSSASPYANATIAITNSNSPTPLTLKTAANGVASIYTELDALTSTFDLQVTADDGTTVQETIELQQAMKAGEIHVTLTTADNAQPPVDIMFVIDTTGSMGDELSFLQTELSDIIAGLPLQQANTNVGLVFYRDYGDAYVVRAHEFTADLNAAQLNLNQELARGGGDYPEAMDQALDAAIGAQWRDNSRKILFLLADAPPHGDRMRATWDAAQQARADNIHLIPVAASGVAEDAEYIMRSIAALTGSRYLFLTDDSGLGLPHAEPDVGCYVVTSLRNSMIRAMNTLVTGSRIEPTDNDIIRTVGHYNNGVCEESVPPQPDPVNYTELVNRQIPLNGTFTQARNAVINNQASLDQELRTYGETAISVDFSTQQVVLLDMGQKNTGGYRVNIESVSDQGDYVQINAEFTGPGIDCAATQALTNPFAMASIDTQKEIRISVADVRYCD